MSNDLLQASIARVRNAFERNADVLPIIKCLVVERAGGFHSDLDDNEPSPAELALAESGHCEMGIYREGHTLWDESGPSCCEIPLRNCSGRIVAGDSLEGRMLQMGSSRVTTLYGPQNEVSARHRAMDKFMSLASDAGKLVRQLPSLPTGWVAPESLAGHQKDALRWIWTVFDLAWANIPGSSLFAERWSWRGSEYASFSVMAMTPEVLEENQACLAELQKFVQVARPKDAESEECLRHEVARIESTIAECVRRLHDFPYPPARYYSVLKDVFGASVHACDVLNSRLGSTPPPILGASKRREPQEPTRPVSLARAATWFKMDWRVVQGAIENGHIAARQQSEKKWVFCLSEVPEIHHPDADPEKYQA